MKSLRVFRLRRLADQKTTVHKKRSRPDTGRRVITDAAVGMLALGTGLLFLWSNLHYNYGQLSAPIDDTFIHLQYASQIGEGNWFRYNPEDPVSTGASSFLYPIILGLGYAAGFKGMSLLSFAIGLGIMLFVAAAVLYTELGRKLGGEAVGIWTGALVAVNGALVWGATSGMEISLLAALVGAGLLAFAHEAPKERFFITPVPLIFAAITRPEGLIFAAGLTVAALVVLSWGVRSRRNQLYTTALSGFLVLLPLVAGAAVQLLFYRRATGTTNGVAAKSLLYEPIFYPTEFIGQVSSNLSNLTTDVLLGLEPAGYLFPGALVFAVLGVSYLAFGRADFRALALSVVAIVLLILPSVTSLGSWNWHSYRYVLPFFPLFLLLAVVGIHSAAGMLGRNAGLGRRHLSLALAGFALLFSLAVLPGWVQRIGRQSAEIREQQVSVGAWIEDNLPEGAIVGLNDAGAIRFVSGHPTVDLVGLTTNGLALPTRNGPGSLFEALESMEPEDRPEYFAIYEQWMGGLGNAGLFDGGLLKTFNLTQSTGITMYQKVSILKADWKLAHTGDLPRSVPEESVRDTLDISDLNSEEAHSYDIRMAQVGLQPPSNLYRMSYPGGETVADGGRTITGNESFTVRDLSPGEPLTIVMRTTRDQLAVTPEEVTSLRVRVDGEDAGEWNLERGEGEWQELKFTIPAELVRGESVRVDLESPGLFYAPYPSHSPYHYWFAQE